MKKCHFAVLLALLMMLIGCSGPDTEGKTYSIIYYGNGNTGGYVPQDTNLYISGQNAVVMDKNTLYKDGQKFLYWNTKQQGNGDTYNPGDTITIKNISIFLYAIWELY
jgi:hypothetical protein